MLLNKYYLCTTKQLTTVDVQLPLWDAKTLCTPFICLMVIWRKVGLCTMCRFNIFANFTYGIEMLSLKVPVPCFGLQTFGIYVPVFEINLWIFHNV